MVFAGGGLQQGSLEENIDVEHIASMSLFSDFFSYVSSTVGSWSVHSIQPLKRLTSKKRVSESAAVQCISAEVQINSNTQGAAEALAESAVKPTRRRSSQGKKSTYPLSEVAVHNKPSDCWIVVKSKVYDVSNFADEHPGGSVISTYFGRDGTDVFSSFHASSTWKILQDFYIGDVERVEPTPELLKDFRDMRALFLREQLFKSSKLYYVMKLLTNVAIFAASIAIICWSKSISAVLASACMMALCIQQCGWLSHDFLHNQVFETRWLNEVVGYVIGNAVLGFSTGWWKEKHNLHHAAPNECDQTYQPIDEDIDTLPLIAWSKDILATVENKTFLRILQYQHLFFMGLLFFARGSWLFWSWRYTSTAALSPVDRLLEKGTVLFHYFWFVGTACYLLPGWKPLVWMAVTELMSGMLLGFVFVLSHNGMEVYNTSKEFVSAQIVSTRDIKGNLFNDWFTGGLNRQIEHHLFPTMPRHNLNKIAPRVEVFCKKHGLVYEDVSIATGTCKVLKALKEVAEAAAEQHAATS
jgi:fatty acid desaturase